MAGTWHGVEGKLGRLHGSNKEQVQVRNPKPQLVCE